MTRAEPVQRTLEIEEPTNRYFIHPLASRLTPWFAAMGIRPNAVSLAGMGLGILAGVAYSQYRDPRYAVAGFVLMIGWHVMDGADGQLARLTRSQSELGKTLDGLCDYVTFLAVYGALALVLSLHYGNAVWGLVLLSGVCHAVQSAAYEAQRQAYQFQAQDQAQGRAPAAGRQAPQGVGAPFAVLLRFYGHLQSLTAGGMRDFDRRFAAILAAQPDRAAALRARYRALFAPAVRRWSVLSANYRTLGIFIAALANRPLYYFWFEIVGFSAILAVLLYRQRARQTLFLDSLRQAP